MAALLDADKGFKKKDAGDADHAAVPDAKALKAMKLKMKRSMILARDRRMTLSAAVQMQRALPVQLDDALGSELKARTGAEHHTTEKKMSLLKELLGGGKSGGAAKRLGLEIPEGMAAIEFGGKQQPDRTASKRPHHSQRTLSLSFHARRALLGTSPRSR